jgi:hypothetical protein
MYRVGRSARTAIDATNHDRISAKTASLNWIRRSEVLFFAPARHVKESITCTVK